ncbi:MAG: beta-eliminating lyase-related protein [Acidimicrobiales bacterium]
MHELTSANRRIHDVECVNLNPATNTMSPAAAAALSSGLGTRTSLGYPGAKYEMGLEAIEEIETIAAQLASEVFDASFVEFRVPSGAMANLMVFMATATAGHAIIVPPATVAGHVTHHRRGAAGLYGLDVHPAPIDPDRYTVDVDGLAALARDVRPRLITLGSSLNLHHHDVAGVRAVADAVGATLMFDAAHLSGPIAGGAWPNPLHEGAHVMTMSTYKSLAGPAAGLVVTNEPDLAERIEAIAFPGLTANFDVGKTAALAHTLNDWLACGTEYAATMVDCAAALADALTAEGVVVHRTGGVATRSHAFALDVTGHGGGMATALRLRARNLLASAIGLPTGDDDGLRIGTNEIVRWGVGVSDMAELASLVARALGDEPAEAVAADVTALRRRFTNVHFTAGGV